MNIKYKTNSPLNLIGGLKYCLKYDKKFFNKQQKNRNLLIAIFYTKDPY